MHSEIPETCSVQPDRSVEQRSGLHGRTSERRWSQPPAACRGTPPDHVLLGRDSGKRGDTKDFASRQRAVESRLDKGKSNLIVAERVGCSPWPLSLSYHLFSDIHENRMEIRDFCHLTRFNCLSCFVRLGLISALDRHQRHQGRSLRHTPDWPPHRSPCNSGIENSKLIV